MQKCVKYLMSLIGFGNISQENLHWDENYRHTMCLQGRSPKLQGPWIFLNYNTNVTIYTIDNDNLWNRSYKLAT